MRNTLEVRDDLARRKEQWILQIIVFKQNMDLRKVNPRIISPRSSANEPLKAASVNCLRQPS